MKLQEQLSREIKGKKYPKYVMTVPPKYIEELGWIKGIELEIKVDGKKLIVRPKDQGKDNKTG